MSPKFCIVHFTEEDSVEFVPDFWIFESLDINYCSWPLNAFPAKCVANRTVPDDKWPSYKCRILNSFGDYETARQHLGQAEITSDFPVSEVVGKRIHKPNKKFLQESSDSSEDSTQKHKKKDSRNEIPRFTSKERTCSEMVLPKALEQKSKRILDGNQNLSSSRRNCATRSRSPLNKIDKRLDQFKEDITLQHGCSTSGTVVQENQMVN